MEKLRPLITHNYWIIFALALILPTVGWWIDTASVNAKTEEAIGKADDAFKNVPPQDSPNATWATDMRKAVNVPLEEDYKNFSRYLYETQRKVQTWPISINAYMQELSFLSPIDPPIRRSYRKAYFKELDEAWKSVDPLTQETPNGKVVFDLSSFIPQVDPGQWPKNPPDSKEMWEVQQDIWLLKALLSAIEKVNHEFDSHSQAPINTIMSIELRGGNPAAKDSPPPSAGATPGMEAATAAAGASSKGFGQGAAGNAGSQGGIDIDLGKLFGPDTIESSGTEATGTAAAAGAGTAGAGSAGLFNAGNRGNGGQASRRRYVDDEEGAPFKTRGFSLKLIMDHTRLPELMIQLSNLEWPVQIVLVQQQSANPVHLKVVGGGRMTGNAAMPGGRPMFGRTGGGRGAARRPAFGRRPTFIGRGNQGLGNQGIGMQGAGRDGVADISNMIAAAGTKTNLAMVTIAGKLTIFQPPLEEEEAVATAETVENENPETPETTDGDGGTENTTDQPSADPSVTEPPASTDQPDSKVPAKAGTDKPPTGGNGTTEKQPSTDEALKPKPPATDSNETDDSTTSSSKEDRPE